MSMCGIRARLEYFKPGEQMRMMYYSVMTQANSEKEIPSAPIRSGQESNLHVVTFTLQRK